MALNTLNTGEISFKKLSGKAHTNQNFAVTEEGITTSVQSSYSTVFAQPITPLPVTNSGYTSLYSSNGIVERIKFQIDIIANTQIAVGQSQGYRLKLPSDYSSHPGKLFPKFTSGTYLHTALGRLQVIPSLYGQLKPDGSTEYDPILYKQDGVTVISKFDPINWYFDPYSGILFIQDPPAGFDTSANRPGYLEAFLYVGDYLDDVLIMTNSGSTGTTGNNVGGGVGVFKNKTTNILNFKTLIGGSHIAITGTTNNVIISFTGTTNPGTITGVTNGLTLLSGGLNAVWGGSLTGDTTIAGNNKIINIGSSFSNDLNQFNISTSGDNDWDIGNSVFIHPSSYHANIYMDTNHVEIFGQTSAAGIYVGGGSSFGTGVGITSNGGSNKPVILNAGTNIGNLVQFSLNNTLHGAQFIDNRSGTTKTGLEYAANYSANYTPRSLVDWGTLTGITSTISVPVTGATNGLSVSNKKVKLGGTVTGNTTVNINPGKQFIIAGHGGYLGINNNSGFTEFYTTGGAMNVGIVKNNSSTVDNPVNFKSNSDNGLSITSQQFIPFNGSFGRSAIEMTPTAFLITDNRVGVVDYPVTISGFGQTIKTDVKYTTNVDIGVLPPQIKTAAVYTTFGDGDIDLVTGGLITVDGHVVTAGQRILVSAQADPTQNGIYLASAGSWTRSTDFDDAEADWIAVGVYVPVTSGNTYANTKWRISDTGGVPAVIDATTILFSQFFGTFIGSGLITIDGVMVSNGDRVLLRGNGAMNGVWIASTGAWTRATDYDATTEIHVGDVFKVLSGSTHAYTGTYLSDGSYFVTAIIDNGTFIVNYSDIEFDQNFFYTAVGYGRKGMEYAGDYSKYYGIRSIPDVNYVTGHTASLVAIANNNFVFGTGTGIAAHTSQYTADENVFVVMTQTPPTITGNAGINNVFVFGEAMTLYGAPSNGGTITDTGIFGYGHTIGDGVSFFGGAGTLTYGQGNINAGNSSLVGGGGSRVIANIPFGGLYDQGAVAIGLTTILTGTELVTAYRNAVNISSNSTGQTVGHGAYGSLSVILGGQDHNIPLNASRSAILGGNKIKAVSGVTDTVYLPKLRIGRGLGASLPTGSTSQNFLVVDGTTGEVQIATNTSSGVATKFATTISGNSVTTTFTVTHNKNTKDVIVQVFDSQTFDTVLVDVVRNGLNTIQVNFGTAPTTGTNYRVLVI